jgi:hypothetical protein
MLIETSSSLGIQAGLKGILILLSGLEAKRSWIAQLSALSGLRSSMEPTCKSQWKWVEHLDYKQGLLFLLLAEQFHIADRA